MESSKENSSFEEVMLKIRCSLPEDSVGTSTKFKSKKIKTVAQFEEAIPEPTTHHKHTIEELLEKCSRFKNSEDCQETLIFLKILINADREMIKKHLHALIKLVSPTMFHWESSIRHCGLNIFSVIFNNVDKEDIVPFFSILSSQLCNAMTHIKIEINIDSLRLLDSLLGILPALILSSTQVLSTFFYQVTIQKNNFSSAASSPSDSLFIFQWRRRILATTEKLMKAIIKNYKALEDVVVIAKTLCEPNDLGKIIEILMPVMFETWCNVAPYLDFGQSSGKIYLRTFKAAKIMKCILQVTTLFIEWMSIVDKNCNSTALMDWFKEAFNSLIMDVFMSQFPYSEGVLAHVGTKSRKAAIEVLCFSVNLTICDIFSILMLNNDKTHTKLQKKFIQYLLYVINRENSRNMLFSVLVKVMKRTVFNVKSDDIKLHLLGLFNFYKTLKCDQRERVPLLKFFEYLNTDVKACSLAELPALQLWAQFLPNEIQLMAENNTTDFLALSVMQQLAISSNPFFMNALQHHVASIIALLQRDSTVVQETMADFICRLPHLSLEVFDELSRAVQNPTVSCQTVCMLLDLLNCRIFEMKDSGINLENYVGFILCATTGMLSDKDSYIIRSREFQQQVENAAQNRGGNSFFVQNVPFNLSNCSIIPSNNIERQLEITEIAIRCLKQFPDVQSIVQCMHRYFCRFMAECTCLPVHAGLSFLSLEAQVNNGALAKDQKTLNFFSELSIGLLIYMYAIDLNETKKDETSYDKKMFSHTCSLINKIGNIGHICDILSVKMRETPGIEQSMCFIDVVLELLKEKFSSHHRFST